MLATDIRGLAMDMKHRLTVEQMERIEKIINNLVGEVAIDSIKQILKFTEENK